MIPPRRDLERRVDRLVDASDDPTSVEFARGKIADEFKEFTGHVEKAQLGGPNRNRRKTIRRETEQKEKPVFSKADISSWNPGKGTRPAELLGLRPREAAKVNEGSLVTEPLVRLGVDLTVDLCHAPNGLNPITCG